MPEVEFADKAIDLALQSVDFILPARALLIELFEDKFDNRLPADFVIVGRALRRVVARDRSVRRFWSCAHRRTAIRFY